MTDRSRMVNFCFAAVLLALVVILQVQNGAYQSDFGGHADEAAHVVTSLMVRDYFAGPLLHLQHPMHYAQDYYDHFPKVALGHYPPGFYIVMGAWLLPFRSKMAILLLCAIITAAAGVFTSREARSLVSPLSAKVAGLLLIILPLVQTYTAIVMSDLLVVVWVILALRCLQLFLETERLAPALWFGTLAALAILTKAAGLFLALVPPLAIVLSGRWRVLKNWRLWMAPVPVILLALPWMIYSWKITADGLSSEPLREYAHKAATFYSSAMVRELGWGGIAFLVISLVIRALSGPLSIQQRAAWAVHWATIFCLLFFYVLTPSGLDERYLLPLLPSAIILALHASETLASFLFRRINAPSASRFAGVGAAVLIAALVWRPTGKLFTGASDGVQRAMTEAAQHPDLSPRILVSGSANCEGAIVAAAALHPRHSAITVVRATKALAESDWMGRNYVTKFSNATSLFSYLDTAHINFVILDTPSKNAFAHEKFLSDSMESAGTSSDSRSIYHLLYQIPTIRRGQPLGQMLLYSRNKP